MASPAIPGPVAPISDDVLLTRLGDALARIKYRDNLSFDDIGREIGRGPDAVALYVKGNADMPVTVFRRAVARWGAAVADPVLTAAGGRLCNNEVQSGDPMAIAAELARLTAMLIEARSPGSPGGVAMHHSELLPIADAAVPLMPMLAAIIAEAARIRS